MRGFIIENDFDESDIKSQIRQEMIKKLASEWNEINSRIERNSWRDEDDRSNEAEYHAEMADEFADNQISLAENKNPNLTHSEKKEIRSKALDEYYAAKDAKDNEIYLKRDVIEELLSELGARMKRPYEHWNEEERYVEYMENRYDLDREFY
jgi:hypothetical protein